ncbi:MAG: Ger(x)C family spore germination protein [Kyrpidia sp.]|nr:Ger(x)C family spore germination protein [Kyrpidia sp.]
MRCSFGWCTRARRTVRRLQAGWLCALACAFFLTGCWDRVEVTDLALVIGMGIDDAPDDGVELTVQLLSPISQPSGEGGTGMQSGGQSSQRAFINYRERGKTLQEALDRLYRTIPRRVFVAHNTVVVFGRRYAEKGFDRALDYIERERNFRRSQIFVVTGGSARDLLNVSTGLERVNSRGLRKLVDEQTRTSITEPSVELRVVNDLLSPSQAPVMVWVDPVGNEPRIKGLGLFRGGKLVDLLATRDSRGLVWLLDRAEQTFIHIPCSGGKKQTPGQSLSVRLFSVHVGLEPVSTPTGLMFRVHAHGQAEVDTVCEGETPTPDRMRQWGDRVAQYMQAEMERTLERLKAKQVDAAQFGTKLFRENPRLWRHVARRWPEMFQTCRVEYDIHINLQRSGMISQSPLEDQTPEHLPSRPW